MRDPNRIDKFCNVLRDEWKQKIPDWRFGQLMSNFLTYVMQETKRDIFFLEEDEMLHWLKRFFAENL